MKKKVLILRLTEPEKEKLHKRAQKEHITMSAYVRQRIFNDSLKVIPVEVHLELKQLVNEVNHIGVNINQIVKNHNSGYFAVKEKKELYDNLKIIEDKMDEIYKLME